MTTTPGSAEARWNHIRDMVYTTVMATFGKSVRRNPDWFEASIDQMEPVLAAKRKALLNYKQKPSVEGQKCYSAGCLPMTYWLNLCRSIHLCADCGNIHDMFEGLRRTFHPNITKMAPVKSASGCVITDCSKQMEKSAEHYQERYSAENVVTEKATECTPSVFMMDELDVLPSIEELGRAILSPQQNTRQPRYFIRDN